ncbi:MAG: DUF3124 domain-containing protein [Lewinellaceae bacterium]|nr:DUF3124 domain-containing protein [Lewinellaceae bacterium]
MKYFLPILLLMAVLTACQEEKTSSFLSPVNWEKRRAVLSEADSLAYESSYLSVYSEIYQLSEKRTYNLTVTVSMRNISSADSLYVLRADYYNTEGKLIRTYFGHPIFIRPMETVEIVIDAVDKSGGTGANFIFDWATPDPQLEPLFEAVMIGTSDQQGLSFTTQGVKR